jgi:ribosome maturation factor RimP
MVFAGWPGWPAGRQRLFPAAETIVGASLDQIAERIAPIADGLGYELVRVRMTGGQSRPTLQIMAERPDHTMDVDDCAKLSRAISDAFETDDPFDTEYVLEVSSPGIDRPLTRPKDYADHAGHTAKFELKTPMEGRKRFRGLLLGLSGGDVAIDAEATHTMPAQKMIVPLHNIAEARLVLTNDLIAADLKRRKMRDAAEKLKS